jgi:uncharacterized protein (DUF1501 family)
MFTLYGHGHQKTCEGYTRRELLQVGTLGIGGLTLSSLLSASAQAANGGPLIKDKAVVLLNLQGGASHIETFDPKMTAPSEYRAMFGEVKTKLPGVTFGSHFPGLASWADRMAIVRCFQHGINVHEKAAHHVMAGGNPTGANMASVFARIAGMNSRRTGIPNATVIRPPAVGEQYKGLGRRFDRFAVNLGTLPSAFKPFDPSAGGEIVQNMKLRFSEDRLDDRRSLLARLDSFKRRVDGTDLLRGADRFEQQAFDVIMGGMSDAFDIGKEDPKLVARYDTGMFEIPQWLKKSKSSKESPSPIALGKQMLLARRLVEADCRFITVTSAGWDMHGNRNTFSMSEGMPLLGPAADKAVTAFLQDLEDRGLSEKVLLVITGDFGRTPRIEPSGGRGHWGDLCTLAFAGGGLPMGQVIGQSDRTAAIPNGGVVTSGNVFATIMGTLVDLAELRITSNIPTDITRYLNASKPIPQLM